MIHPSPIALAAHMHACVHNSLRNVSHLWDRQGIYYREVACATLDATIDLSTISTMRSAPVFSKEKPKLCSCLQYRSVLVLVVGLSIIHILVGAVSICLGTISSIQGLVWMAHRVSPIWSGAFVSLDLISFRYVRIDGISLS